MRWAEWLAVVYSDGIVGIFSSALVIPGKEEQAGVRGAVRSPGADDTGRRRLARDAGPFRTAVRGLPHLLLFSLPKHAGASVTAGTMTGIGGNRCVVVLVMFYGESRSGSTKKSTKREHRGAYLSNRAGDRSRRSSRAAFTLIGQPEVSGRPAFAGVHALHRNRVHELFRTRTEPASGRAERRPRHAA